MNLNHYRFRSTWRLDASPAAVYDALEEVREYPRWWPEIRAVHQVSDDVADAVCRALLPYRLDLRLTQEVRDRSAGVLRVTLSGDLVGWSSWRVVPDGTDGTGHTRAVFEEEVEATKPLLRALAPLARPLFRANHAAMMVRGERGLRRFLGARA